MTDLEHSGVKGMKWGVHRKPKTDADGNPHPKSKGTKLKQQLNSLKRERDWGKVLKEVDMLTTKEIGVVAKRIGLENDLKKYSKTKMATAKDKKDYLNRERMSDDELKRKVDRLKAKDNLHQKVSAASQAQRDFGKKVVQIGGSLGYKYVVNRRLGKKLGYKDVMDVLDNTKTNSDGAKSAVIDKVSNNNDVLKDILTRIANKPKS